MATTYHDWARDGSDVSHVSISRDGDLAKLLVRRGDMVNQYVVDHAQGTNLVELFASDGPGRDKETWKYTYEKVAGVWVPRHVSLSMDRASGSHIVRTLQWTENRVNEQIKEAEFALVKLGLRRGDSVDDQRTGQRFLIEGREFPRQAPRVGQRANPPYPSGPCFCWEI